MCRGRSHLKEVSVYNKYSTMVSICQQKTQDIDIKFGKIGINYGYVKLTVVLWINFSILCLLFVEIFIYY